MSGGVLSRITEKESLLLLPTLSVAETLMVYVPSGGVAPKSEASSRKVLSPSTQGNEALAGPVMSIVHEPSPLLTPFISGSTTLTLRSVAEVTKHVEGGLQPAGYLGVPGIVLVIVGAVSSTARSVVPLLVS